MENETNGCIKVLQVTIGDGNFGGVASFLFSYYSNMDHNKIHFDFLYCGENSMQSKELDPVLNGSTITTLHILKRNNNGFKEYTKLIAELKKFFLFNHYDIVHVNSSNPYINACVASILEGNTVYIAHSHNTQSTIIYGSKGKHIIKLIIGNIIRSYIIRKADALFACSDEAGRYLFGEKGVKKDKFKIINNAIDVTKYEYDLNIRKQFRKGEDIIVGFVGRLSDQKNPIFAVDIFIEILKTKPNAIMWIIGDGELRDTLFKKIARSNLQNKVYLLGQRNDVALLMQAMDVLVFPSVYEGLGIVAVEAQCSGLPVIASNIVPQRTNVAGLVTYLSLSDPASVWANQTIQAIGKRHSRVDRSHEIEKAGYGIQGAAKLLEQQYNVLYSAKNNR